jgi:thiosulfate reductase cytochrome b subunit
VGLLFIWAAMLANGHFRRNLTTTPRDWTPAAVIASLKSHLGGAAAHGYNPVQRILYGLVLGVLLPLMVFTGLAISPGFEPAAPWLVDALGGRQSARSLHFLAAWGLFGFFVIHVVLALANWRQIGAMITGRHRNTPAAPSPAPEGAPDHA